MKFLVFTYSSQGTHEGCSFDKLAELTRPSKIEYCKTHNYVHLDAIVNENYNKPIGWLKIEVFLKEIENYDWILYVEADAMILNQTIRLENLIDDNYDIIVAKNRHNKKKIEINCGVMLVKCSEWSKNFFKNLLEDTSNSWFEQGAIMDKINNDQEIRKHFKLVENRFFNSYFHEWYPDDNFRPGDFILHAAGSSNSFREKLFSFLQDKIVRVPKYDIPLQPFV